MARPFRASYLGAAPGRQLKIWSLEEPSRCLLITASDAFASPSSKSLPLPPSAFRAFVRALGRARLLVQILRTPLLWHRGTWNTLQTKDGTHYLWEAACRAFIVDGSLDPNEWELGNVEVEEGGDDSALDDLLALVKGLKEVKLPPNLNAQLAGTHDRPEIPSFAGILKHPVGGSSPEGAGAGEEWLSEFDPRHLPAADPTFPHLKALFSSFPLTPHAHAALYCYLLGALHAASLRYARPILMVSSWEQGRGKSEVCQAISRLIDDEDASTSLPSDKDAGRDELIAHFLDRRSLILDNVDGVSEWNSPLMATLATGSGSMRRKYSRGADKVRGVMIMANTVLGTATLHPDLVARLVHVELPGRAQLLEVQPRFYAEEHRLEILSEALEAHRLAQPGGPPRRSRFQQFEAAGAAAYSVIWGVPVGEVYTLLDAAAAAARVFVPEVMLHLFSTRRDLFLAPNRRVLEDHAGPGPVGNVWGGGGPERFDGAEAFGLRIKGGEWS